MPTKPSKYYITQKIEEMAKEKPSMSILDLGSGKSLNFEKILKNFPQLSYTGIEPKKSDYEMAREKFKSRDNAVFINSLAYENNPLLKDQYDLVVSFSVLEHVKYLDKFLNFAAQKTKLGGTCIHLYDLGHALYPSSLKERLHVWLCSNSFTQKFIPETKFVCYLSSLVAEQKMKEMGLSIDRVTFHNSPDHVKLIKTVGEDYELIKQISENEVVWSSKIKNRKQQEILFPAVCIWSRKIT